jgi:hypothetical protein
MRTFFLSGVVAALVLAVAAGQPAWSQGGPTVILDVLNEVPPGMADIVVVQGFPVEVHYQDEHGNTVTGTSDLIRLRRVEDGKTVSQRLRGEGLSGTVLLSTSSKDALGWLEVIYLLVDGTVLAVAEESVLVVEGAPDPLSTVVVPSPEAPTIQAAIDLVPDGGTVKIKPGDYEVDLLQPIVVTGKSITIQGAGSSRRARPGRGKLTRLIAPPPDKVVDAELATGVINYIGAGGVLRDLDVSGGDACVVGRDLGGAARALLVESAFLSHSARGVLWKAPSDLTVTDSKIEKCTWNGISFSPGAPAQATLEDLEMESIFNIGILILNSLGYCDDVAVGGCDGGGIVAYNSIVGVVDSWLPANSFAAIALYGSAGVITDNFIWMTHPVPSGPYAGWFGDGLDAYLCPLVIVTGNRIHESARAGIANFGSTMKLGSNDIACAGYELEGEDYQGVAFVFENLGGNGCGCPFAEGVCVVESAGIQAPEPAAPIE